jgi:hypothetical protein
MVGGMHGFWTEVHEKGFAWCDLFGVSNEVDSPVHYILIQCVSLFWSFGRVYGMIVVDQFRVILMCITSSKTIEALEPPS